MLMVDVSGFSRLIDLDTLGTALRVRWLRQHLLISGAGAHGGRVVDSSGDGALLAFAGAPEALACALTIQHMLDAVERASAPDQRLRLHMGLSAGEVLLIDGELYGHAVNIAARLVALAEPGGICVCEAALDQLDRGVAAHLEPLGEQRLRNIAQPVRAFRVAREALTGALPLGSLDDEGCMA
jgi:adenylate cyclase